MDRKRIIKFCKDLGCCDACCLRYIGLKSPKFYENPRNVVHTYSINTTVEEPQTSTENTSKLDENKLKPENDLIKEQNGEPIINKIIDDKTNDLKNTDTELNDSIINNDIDETKELNTATFKTDNSSNKVDNSFVKHSHSENVTSTQESAKENGSYDVQSPPVKRCKLNVCASCLGVLQEDLWEETFAMVREVLDKKGYECDTFACGLSSPIALILREQAITLRVMDKFALSKLEVTGLKETWKWTFATKMAPSINKTLDSGAISPLLITLNYDYPDELQELEILKTISPKLFESRSKQKRRFTTEFTRRSVEQALEDVTLSALTSAGGALPVATTAAKCVSVVCTHSPIYLGGRYLKLSRNLPQSPWVLEGRRVLPSSVQEIIFKPIADLYRLTAEEAEQRLKFVAAGREDVDVRCLGDGRPFAIEITDPRRQLTVEELTKACQEIQRSGDVIVNSMVTISREDLTELKKGEESKSKTYEALCIKLTHSKYDDVQPNVPIKVTEEDLKRINEYRNTAPEDPVKIRITQKTPIRVLHRRPLLTRSRGILELAAYDVPEHPHLFRIVVSTTAGTYVKEWACGELGRTAPSLADVMRARVSLLALDVAAVKLDWPPKAK